MWEPVRLNTLNTSKSGHDQLSVTFMSSVQQANFDSGAAVFTLGVKISPV